jgi:DNA integrity scanning protein DisA with diadenylate cyclase activity
LLATAFGMELLSAILGQFMNVGVLALLIIFQQEIRRFLLMLGRSTSFKKMRF